MHSARDFSGVLLPLLIAASAGLSCIATVKEVDVWRLRAVWERHGRFHQNDAAGPDVASVRCRAPRPLVPAEPAAPSAHPVPTAAAAGHFGSHFRGRSLGGEASGTSEAAFGMDGRSGHGSRTSEPAHASRHSSPAKGARDGHGRSTESIPYGTGIPGLMHAPSAVGSVAVSQAASTRRNVLEMSAVPRVQQGSPKVHVPYSTSPSDHVHLGDHKCAPSMLSEES